MAVSEDRKYTKAYIYNLLEGVKGKTLAEVDSSHQLERTIANPKITGIAGDIIEQSVFGYQRDHAQECDIEIDGVLTELKTTGVRVPKKEAKLVEGKIGDAYNKHLAAKEGVTITNVTFEPTYQKDFMTSHFWEKSEHILFVFYEYKSYATVLASEYADFPIVDYCYNKFQDDDLKRLKCDWEVVRDYLKKIYESYSTQAERYKHLDGFTHELRPKLSCTELVPSFKFSEEKNQAVQKPRYRLKKTFVDYIVRGHFDKSRAHSEVKLKESFDSFDSLDARCHLLAEKYKGTTLQQFHDVYHVKGSINDKNFAEKCVLFMFATEAKKLNSIADFNKCGIIAKTITLKPGGKRTEDMKLQHIDFEEWGSRNQEFEESDVYSYFCEHSFLCPVFCERGKTERMKCDTSDLKEAADKRVLEEIGKTTFEGFKRFAFDDKFIDQEVKRTWSDSRSLIFNHELKWEYVLDKNGNKKQNKSGSYMGAPNFPKSAEYQVFFRGGQADSSDKYRIEEVNCIKMLPQYFWLKGTYIADKLKEIAYL